MLCDINGWPRVVEVGERDRLYAAWGYTMVDGTGEDVLSAYGLGLQEHARGRPVWGGRWADVFVKGSPEYQGEPRWIPQLHGF